MFGLISTKDLYIVELKMLNNKEYINMTTSYQFSDYTRYVLATKKHGYYRNDFYDVFTSTKYTSEKDYWKIGAEVVREYMAVITNKKYLTIKEASLLLKELNDIYICDTDNIIPFQRILSKKNERK